MNDMQAAVIDRPAVDNFPTFKRAKRCVRFGAYVKVRFAATVDFDPAGAERYFHGIVEMRSVTPFSA